MYAPGELVITRRGPDWVPAIVLEDRGTREARVIKVAVRSTDGCWAILRREPNEMRRRRG